MEITSIKSGTVSFSKHGGLLGIKDAKARLGKLKKAESFRISDRDVKALESNRAVFPTG